MKTSRGVSLLVAVGVALTAAPAVSAQSADEQSIRATIAEYFRGHATADSTVMRRPFLPTAHIEGIRQGVFSSWTLDQYVGGSRGTPAADEARRSRRIDVVSVVGSAAMAQATLDHVGVVFTDFFVLLKVNGEWKIANKVYHAAPRTP
jgi:3-hydroxyisobutyrate dehydrogenase